MIYFDNASTSRFKPKSVIDALLYDITHSSNASRSAHKEAIEKNIQIQKCRDFLKTALGADDSYNVIFTKNCTEALNLAILGGIKNGANVVTSQNEHNSVLRPLFKLKKEGKINLQILEQDENGRIRMSEIEECAKTADVFVFGGASNVTGTVADMEEIGKIAQKHNILFIADGAQSIPILPMQMASYGVNMLSIPAHKGLHGIQGVGALIAKKNIPLVPLTFGGTGTHSTELEPFIESPDCYEVGTQFSGGISAMYQGAQWSFANVDKTHKNLVRLSNLLIYGLKNINAKIYTQDVDTGIVSFNIKDFDSTYIGDKLNDYDICVRCGLHCAPLVHKHLGTLNQGAIRVSFGCDNTDKEVMYFLSVLEKIIRSFTT